MLSPEIGACAARRRQLDGARHSAVLRRSRDFGLAADRKSHELVDFAAAGGATLLTMRFQSRE
ncbi:MAG: hypothetical protein IPK39_24085 [Sulfuritalea sp.]|nr:hypothetical protein [Sulfuritalea sp.]